MLKLRRGRPPLPEEVRLANKKKSQQKWRDNNKEKHNETNRQWRKNNAERQKQLVFEWQKANVEKVREKSLRWHKTHPEQSKAAHALWVKNNPDKQLAINRNRRARKRHARGSCSAAQAQARCDFYGGLCAYCRKELHPRHFDHVIPLSRGGTNWPANLRPSCASCNTSKGTRLLSEWTNRPYV